MKISIGPNANTDQIILCAGGKESPLNFTVNGQTNVQVREFLRGDWAKPINRGNKLTRVTWDIDFFFKFVRDAEAYVVRTAAYFTSQPASSVLTIEGTSGFGGTSLSYIEDCVIETLECRSKGTNVVGHFAIVGGKRGATKPT